jgi:hypothetical protein
VCAVSIVCLEVFALFLREREREEEEEIQIDDVTRFSLVPEEFPVWFLGSQQAHSNSREQKGTDSESGKD